MKKRGMKKRVLAALMTVCMTVGLSGGVLADTASGETTTEQSVCLEPESKYYKYDGTPTTEEAADIVLSKTAEYNAEDDNYTITLNAKAKPKKTHVVFLLDATEYKNYCDEYIVPLSNMYRDYLSKYRDGMSYEGLGFPDHYHYPRGAHNCNSLKPIPTDIHKWNHNANGCNKIDEGIVSSRYDLTTSAIKTMREKIGSENVTYNFMYSGYKPNGQQGVRSQGESTSEEPYSELTGKEGNTFYINSFLEWNLLPEFKDDSSDTDKVLIIVACKDRVDDQNYEGYNRGLESTLNSFKGDGGNGKVYTIGFKFNNEETSKLEELASQGDNYKLTIKGKHGLDKEVTERLEEAADEIKKIRATIEDPLGSDVELDGDVEVSGCDDVAVSESNDVKASDSDAQLKVTSDKIELSVDDLAELEDGVTLTYNVKVKANKTGLVKLNGNAVLKYTKVGEEGPALEFPVPTAVRSGSIDNIENLLSVTLVHTGSNAEHYDETYDLLPGSYTVKTASNATASNATVAYVTVGANKYVDLYNENYGTHAVIGAREVARKLVYDAEAEEWQLAEDQDPDVTFIVKCDGQKKDDDKKDDDKKDDEKQYTNIKFVVVNGSFTENGQTEIAKTFEVGTKLTLADIPASKGKSSRYSDQTWDKYPLGYVVGTDGTTFTITYLWRSDSDGDSDSGDNGGSTTTRGRATNAAGKSGHWILEGGEFTEDNGKLPSNEYLKIGDTIYGFYTYGFAIDFDRPEYYTDEAIQARGGYRDASGTWRLNGWWFLYDDGTFPHNEWVYLSWNGRSDWYYFDVDGWMEDNWFYWNNNWYYLHTKYDNTRGHMYTGWHEIDGKWYYFNTASDKGTLGAMLADTTTPDGYKVDKNGAWIQ